jgi:predicted GTPase
VRRLGGEIGLGPDEKPIVISAATGEGIRDLLERCYALVKGETAPVDWRR